MSCGTQLVIPFRWEERHAVLIGEGQFLYIPPLYTDHTPPCELESCFPSSQPLAVEYCSGNGEWVVTQAKATPELNWIAVEKDFERARKIWRRMQREGLKNLLVVCGEGSAFTSHYTKANSFSKVYVNFPDPWPKRRHAKYRIIQPSFACQLLKVLKKEGSVTIVTDDIQYSEQIVASFPAPWKWAFDKPYLEEWPDFGTSFFYDLFRKLNRPIRYHQFCL